MRRKEPARHGSDRLARLNAGCNPNVGLQVTTHSLTCKAGAVCQELQRRLHDRHSPVLQKKAGTPKMAHIVTDTMTNSLDQAVGARHGSVQRGSTCSAPISGVHAKCTLGSSRGVSGSGAVADALSWMSGWICNTTRTIGSMATHAVPTIFGGAPGRLPCLHPARQPRSPRPKPATLWCKRRTIAQQPAGRDRELAPVYDGDQQRHKH